MKKHLIRFLSIALITFPLLISSSCKKNLAPTVCLGHIADSAYVGQTLTFSTCTNGEQLYIWNFGDGTIDSLKQYSGLTVNHSYNTAGTYTGSLTIFTNLGQSNKKSFIVHVVSGGTWTFNGVTYQATTYTYPYQEHINATYLYQFGTALLHESYTKNGLG